MSDAVTTNAAPATTNTLVPSNAAPAKPMTRQEAMAQVRATREAIVTKPTRMQGMTSDSTTPQAVEGAVKYRATGSDPATIGQSQGTEAQGENLEATQEGQAQEGQEEAQSQEGQETQGDEGQDTDYQQKYSELMDSGDLHESLHEKLLLAKIDGVETPITVKEALKGYMRRSDHSKAMNELSSRESQVGQEKQNFYGMLETLKQRPELALEVFSERLGPTVVEQMFQAHQKQVAEYESVIMDAGSRVVRELALAPELVGQHPEVLKAMAAAKQRLDHQKSLEAENRALKKKAEQFEAKQQQETVKQEADTWSGRFKATMSRFADTALKANKLPCNDITRLDLSEQVAQLLVARNYGKPEKQKDYTVSGALVQEAVEIMKETRGANSVQREEPLPARQGMGTGSGATMQNTTKPRTRQEIMADIKARR